MIDWPKRQEQKKKKRKIKNKIEQPVLWYTLIKVIAFLDVFYSTAILGVHLKQKKRGLFISTCIVPLADVLGMQITSNEKLKNSQCFSDKQFIQMSCKLLSKVTHALEGPFSSERYPFFALSNIVKHYLCTLYIPSFHIWSVGLQITHTSLFDTPWNKVAFCILGLAVSYLCFPITQEDENRGSILKLSLSICKDDTPLLRYPWELSNSSNDPNFWYRFVSQ